MQPDIYVFAIQKSSARAAFPPPPFPPTPPHQTIMNSLSFLLPSCRLDPAPSSNTNESSSSLQSLKGESSASRRRGRVLQRRVSFRSLADRSRLQRARGKGEEDESSISSHKLSWLRRKVFPKEEENQTKRTPSESRPRVAEPQPDRACPRKLRVSLWLFCSNTRFSEDFLVSTGLSALDGLSLLR